MGSQARDPSTLAAIRDSDAKQGDEEQSYTILVTGFGPFGTHLTNPSHLITTSLPPTLSVRGPAGTVTIHIHRPPTALPVSYASSSTLIPQLLAPSGPHEVPDMVLHVGVASARGYYAIERFGRRDGYAMADVEGRRPVGGRAGGGTGPAVLGTSLLGEDEGVLRAWREGAPAGVELSVSDDAGRYLCDFTYYTSLLQFWRRRREIGGKEAKDGERGEEGKEDVQVGGPVLFLHVPDGVEEEDVRKGVQVVEGLIRALVLRGAIGKRNKAGSG